MSTLQIVPPNPHFTECIVCSKPLGQDSQDLGYRVCLEHRKCVKCGHDLNPREVRLAHERMIENGESIEEIELSHPRCSILTHSGIADDPTLSIKQSEYDYLNMLRLMVVPDCELNVVTNENNAMIQSSRLLSSMDFDAKMLHLKMMEACVANLAIAIRQDPKYRKDALKERESKIAKQAKAEALTSSRPAGKPVDHPEEVELGRFMEVHGLLERKTAMKILRDRTKAIQQLMNLNIPESVARESINQDLIKKGILKK